MPDINNEDAKIGQQNVESTVYNNNVYPSYGEKKIKKFLGVLPFFSETFLGREDDLEAVHQKLFEGNNLLLLVNGEGGIGKTTLAAQYYRKYQDDYQHLAWVFTGNSLADALLTLAMPLELSFADTMPAEERLQKLLDNLRNLNKTCLLVIDNANEVKDIIAHYRALRSCTNFHLLLTTRITEFDQAATHKMEPLQKLAAFELFKKHYPNHRQAEDEVLENILVAVGYNTLVIELLAKSLRNLNRLKTHYSLGDLLQDLQNKGLLALSQARPVSSGYHATGNALREENPQSIIEAMYDLGELPESESALLSVFAVLPAESIGFQTLETLLPDNGTLEETLLTLSQKGWLDHNETGASFKVSPVVQEITKKKNHRLLNDSKGLLNSLIEKLLHEGGTGHFINASYNEASLYVRYAETVINSFKQANNQIAILCERAGNYHRTTGNLNKALQLYEHGTRLFAGHNEAYPENEGFKNGLAIAYQNLGNTYTSLGNVNKALQFYEDYNRLEKELYEAFPQNLEFKKNLATSYSKLGETQTSLGNLDKALKFYENETLLFEELYEAQPQNASFKNGLATSYEKLGHMHTSLGNRDKASQFYEQDAQLSKELCETHPENVDFKNGLAIAYYYLGVEQDSRGDFDKALKFYGDYNRLEKELYEAFPQNVEFKNNLAISYGRLGSVQASLGHMVDALKFYEKSNILIKELHEEYPQHVGFKNGLAVSYISIGYLHGQNQKKEESKNYYLLSQKLLIELVDKFPEHVKFKENRNWVQEQLSEG